MLRVKGEATNDNILVSKPKATNSRVSDCYLTPNQQFSAISWRDQVNFQ
jgi:hypothetical protein